MAILTGPNQKKKIQKTEGATARVIKKLHPASQLGPFKGAFYGRNKQGKTHLAGSSKLKTLIIDCNEKGFETVADRPNVTVYELERFAETEDLYWWAKAGNHDIELFVFDTVSMLSTMCLKHVMNEAEQDMGAGSVMPGRQHYGRVNQLMSNLIIDWRNLPYNIIFLAQERRWETADDEASDDETVVVEITPSLSKGPLQTLQSAVGTIGRVYIREAEVKGKPVIEHRLLIGPHPLYAAGTRIRALAGKRTLRNPTLQQILDLREQGGEVPPGEAVTGMKLED